MTSNIELEPSSELIDTSKITAIALCGGLGTRMNPVTKNLLPKSLVLVDAKPLLDYSIHPLVSAGIKRFIFAVSHRADQVIDYVKKSDYGVRQDFSIEPIASGVTSAVKFALNSFDIDSPITVFDTDVVRIGLDFKDAYRFHVENRAKTTLVCASTHNPKDSNFIVEQDGLQEAALIVLHGSASVPLPAVIKCGMIITSKETARFIRDNPDIGGNWIDLTEALSTLGDMKVYLPPSPILYHNVNTPNELIEAEKELQSLSANK